MQDKYHLTKEQNLFLAKKVLVSNIYNSARVEGINITYEDINKVLIIDELDKSLHPFLVHYIVEIFNDRDINKNGSQLIFNTYDTNLLDLNILRRDQIWFTEKNSDNGESELYSLSDFSVRKQENIEKGYILGRYGSVPVIKNDLNLWEEK